MNLEFYYPENILSIDYSIEDILAFEHSVPCYHPDHCDFIGDGRPPLDKLVDLKFTIQVYKSDLKTVLKSKVSDYILTNFFKNDSLVISKGFIEKKQIGNLNGYKLNSSIEGCGTYTYYLALPDETVIIITRPYSPELVKGMLTDEWHNKYISIEGVILPEEADRIFEEILGTMKLVK